MQDHSSLTSSKYSRETSRLILPRFGDTNLMNELGGHGGGGALGQHLPSLGFVGGVGHLHGQFVDLLDGLRDQHQIVKRSHASAG